MANTISEQAKQANQSNRQKDFIAEIKTQGLARTNRFTVELSPPAESPDSSRRILLFCEQASLPGISFATTSNKSYGESREIAYDRLFEPITLQFHVDRHFQVKKVFDKWMQVIQDPVSKSFNYYNNYTTKISIAVQDLQDMTCYQVNLFECYPKIVAPVSLDAESKDTMRLQVTFQYKYWESSKVETLPNGLKVSTDSLNKYMDDFSGFQERFRKGLGEAANFTTGAVGQLGMRAFSQVTSKLPAIKF
jgi:hypothetical protein